jgi:FkbM family methyltransferase
MTPIQVEEQQMKELYSDNIEAVNIAGKVHINILLFRRNKHDFQDGWENEYLSELADTLKPGMVVFDIGAENAEFTAMAAKIVGCENVHIFEPSKDYWPNIKRLWDVNEFDKVGGCFNGYVGEKSELLSEGFGWPSCINGEIFYGTNHSVPQYAKEKTISIDDYCSTNGILPDVIMMDIEGAELSALRGCLNVLKSCSPIFFISIHNDDMIKQRSNGSRQDIHDLLSSFGYNSKHINTDHEEHWKFFK